jgi:flagellar hook-basal body complex protein FliE
MTAILQGERGRTMSALGIGGLLGGSASPVAAPTAPNVGAGGTGSPFGGIFKSLVEDTSELSKKAEHAVSGLLSGSGVDVHEAMIATQKADVAFELALQVRNKAVGAYQTMMGMQF